RERLDHAGERLGAPGCTRIKDVRGIYYLDPAERSGGKLAFLFPGEGSQYLNMLADLCLHFPEVRAQFDRIDRIFREQGRPYLPSDFIFPRPAFSPEQRKLAEERIWQMEGAVEAVL